MRVARCIIGAPSEGYGVSNNKIYAFATPQWSESKKFQVYLRY